MRAIDFAQGSIVCPPENGDQYALFRLTSKQRYKAAGNNVSLAKLLAVLSEDDCCQKQTLNLKATEEEQSSANWEIFAFKIVAWQIDGDRAGIQRDSLSHDFQSIAGGSNSY